MGRREKMGGSGEEGRGGEREEKVDNKNTQVRVVLLG